MRQRKTNRGDVLAYGIRRLLSGPTRIARRRNLFFYLISQWFEDLLEDLTDE
jgi:hypothetical protein